MTDDEAFEAISAGDQEGLNVLYRRYREKCIRYIYRHLPTENPQQDAADLYQDAVLALYENIQKGRLQYLWVKTDTYLIAIIKRMSLRRRGLQARTLLVVPAADTSEEHPDLRRQRLRRALDKLEEKCRAMITLRHFDQMDYEDVARMLDYKNGATVRNLIARCREKLRQLFTLEPELPYQSAADKCIAQLDGLTEEE